MRIADADTTKLYVGDDGAVWSLPGNGMPAKVAGDVLHFLVGRRRPASNWRLLGLPQNAHLLLALETERGLRCDGGAVEVASPRSCAPEELRCPRRTLTAMRKINCAASTGGWHHMADADLHTYGLIHRLRGHGPATDATACMLRPHPLYRALSFVNYADLAACCELVATVVDPRWYVDARRPDSLASLFSYTGLVPSTFRAALQGRRSGAAHRARLVLRCWCPEREERRPHGGAEIEPRSFLWHVVHRHGGGPKGLFHASRAFVSYVRHAWLDAIYEGGAVRDRLFVPEYFFEPYVCQAYAAHVANPQRA